jgi:hypothetical protein
MSIPRLRRIPITEGLVGEDERTRKRCLRELDNQLDEIYNMLQTIVSAGGEVAAKDGPYVLHGSTVPESLPGAELHRNMTADDLHWPKDHAGRHAILGGTGIDPFTTSHLIDAMVRRIYSLGTMLTVQAIADGEYLKRSGTDIISSTISGGGLGGMADAETPSLVSGTTYRWANTVSPQASLICEVNGVIQIQRTAAGPDMGYYDWVSATDIEFEKLPSDTRHIRGWYRYVP